MFTLAFLTDPHLAPLPTPSLPELCSKRILGYLNWKLHRKAFHSRAVLDRLTTDMLARKPDHIAIGGDLVNLSLRDEFGLALHWLQTLGSPEDVSVIPGNHDTYVRMNPKSGIELWRAYMTPDVKQTAALAPSSNGFPWVRRFGKIALVGLSSAVPKPPFFASGKLGPDQLDALARILEELGSSGFYRVVMVHHAPLIGMTDARRGLNDDRELQATLENKGAELVLFGHRHFHSLSDFPDSERTTRFVGGPSASAAHGAPEGLARYYLFRIGKKSGNWHCEMSSRGLTVPDGPVVDIESTTLTA